MHISKLGLVNYGNFANSKVIFKKGTNTITGENGSGKTNLFHAIRLLLDNNMLRSTSRLGENALADGNIKPKSALSSNSWLCSNQ